MATRRPPNRILNRISSKTTITPSQTCRNCRNSTDILWNNFGTQIEEKSCFYDTWWCKTVLKLLKFSKNNVLLPPEISVSKNGWTKNCHICWYVEFWSKHIRDTERSRDRINLFFRKLVVCSCVLHLRMLRLLQICWLWASWIFPKNVNLLNFIKTSRRGLGGEFLKKSFFYSIRKRFLSI